MSTVSNFLRNIKANLKGDKTEIASIRFEKMVMNELKQQIGSLESQSDKEQFAIENAEDKLKNLMYPEDVNIITQYVEQDNIESYFQALINQEAEIERLKKQKEQTEKSLTWYRAKHEMFSRMVNED